MELLGAASAVVTKYGVVKGSDDSGVAGGRWKCRWVGEGALGGRTNSWPVQAGGMVRLPAGLHVVSAGPKREGIVLTDLNARLRSAAAEGRRMVFDYTSDSRAIARFDRKPGRVEVDGVLVPVECPPAGECMMMLPRGEHRVAAGT